ncbi:MAG: hypothetical protein K0R57_1232 [Paenibacillaceae bacterium]|jgi:two-component system sensor histidine kinase YesM|nr:hypothetical protein [Paenibacillaceae bacterium]
MFKKKLSIKLIASLSVLIMFLFLASGYITYRVYLRLFTDEITKQFNSANEQAAARVDFQILNIYKSTNYIVFHPYIEEILRRSAERSDNTFSKRMQDQDELAGLLNQISIDEPRLSSMYVYDANGSGYFFENNSGTVIPLGQAYYDSILRSLEGSNGELVWLPLRVPSIDSSGYRNVISVSRYMKNKKQEQYGILIMIFDKSIFGSILDELAKEGNGRIFLLDGKGSVIYSNKAEDRQELEQLAAVPDSRIVRQGQEPVFVSRHQASQFGLTLISGLSLQSINSQSRGIVRIAVYTGLASVLCAAMLIFFTGKKLLRPLHTLVAGMKRLRGGRFDTRIRISTQDELAFLGQSFNEMAEKIESLVKEVYERKLNEREAELTALQAQLNPHFLYNTLDTIYLKMYLGENDEQTAELVLALSGLLRYALQNPHTQTTVRDEIDHISKYISIQSARIGGRLETFIQVDEEAEPLPVMRLIMQPLVENAFVHAFAHTSKVCILRIKASLQHRSSVEGAGGGRVQSDAGGKVQSDTGGRVQSDAGGKVRSDAGVRVQSDTGGQVQSDAGGQVQSDTGGQVQSDAGGKSIGEGGGRVLSIEVSDNGQGMSGEQMSRLMRMQSHRRLEETASSPAGIGLKTVIRRISLLYGPPYGLEIESSPGNGTTMRLILPVQEPPGELR